MNGYRNPSEDILITINDIPEGFGLAEKIGDIYSPVGATDPFGTTTLFSVQADDSTNKDENKYSVLNSEIFLVKISKGKKNN